MVQHMKFYDANASFGIDMVNHECVNHENFIVLEKVSIAKNAPELLEYMDFHGIYMANVWHRAMYEYNPMSGNEKLTEEIGTLNNRLTGSWAILPSITDREFDVNIFFDRMKKHNIRTLHAFPVTNRYFLRKVTMEEQLQYLDELRIPLYLSPKDGFEYIYQVLEEFPMLTVILYNIGWWPSARFLFPLLKRFPNVYFETGDFSMLRGFETACNLFGSERILFGTNFPTNNMSGSINTLLKSSISENDKENISHRNMERLLSEVRL